MKCDRFIGTGTVCVTQQPRNSDLRRFSGSCSNIKRVKRYPLRQKPPVLRTKSMVATSVRLDRRKNITSVMSHINNDYITKFQIQEQDNQATNRTSDNSILSQTPMIEGEHDELNDCEDGDRGKIVDINHAIISTSSGKTKVN